MLIKGRSSELALNPHSFNDGCKQISRNKVFLTNYDFIFMLALLNNDLPCILSIVTITEKHIYKSMGAVNQ